MQPKRYVMRLRQEFYAQNGGGNPIPEIVESLFGLWARYQSTLATACATPSGPHWDALCAEFHALAEQIAAAPVAGFGDIEAKLRVLWSWWIDDRTEALHGAQPDSDDRTRVFWSLIEAVAVLAARERKSTPD